MNVLFCALHPKPEQEKETKFSTAQHMLFVLANKTHDTEFSLVVVVQERCTTKTIEDALVVRKMHVAVLLQLAVDQYWSLKVVKVEQKK